MIGIADHIARNRGRAPVRQLGTIRVGDSDYAERLHPKGQRAVRRPKTPNGIAEVPLTDLALEAFREQIRISGQGPWLFPSDENTIGHQKTLKTVWHAALRRAKMPYFRVYDRRSTYATRLSAGGVADEWVTQLLRQGDAKAFKKYSQMKLQMKREALQKLNRKANEGRPGFDTERPN